MDNISLAAIKFACSLPVLPSDYDEYVDLRLGPPNRYGEVFLYRVITGEHWSAITHFPDRESAKRTIERARQLPNEANHD